MGKDKPKFGSFLEFVTHRGLGSFEPLDLTPAAAPTPGDDDSVIDVSRRRKRERRLEHRLDRLETQRGESAELPTIHEFRNVLGTLTQKRAAQYLRCTPRMIRVYIQKGELCKVKGGRVKCDDKLIRKLREKYPRIRLE
jgi:hypothetical protein